METDRSGTQNRRMTGNLQKCHLPLGNQTQNMLIILETGHSTRTQPGIKQKVQNQGSQQNIYIMPNQQVPDQYLRTRLAKGKLEIGGLSTMST